MEKVNKDDFLATSFRDVDAANGEKIVHCLDGMQAMSSFQRYKEHTMDLLSDGENYKSAIDIACGLGDDVIRLKRYFARAVGVDSSATLINEATRRHEMAECEFHCADAANLPFVDGEFDCARVDRSLQHIANPDRVVREMLRVVRVGGKVLCAEPDWGTFFVGTPLSDTTKAIQNYWGLSFQNPWIGRNLQSIMKTAGVQNLVLEGHVLITKGFEVTNLVFDISKTADRLKIQQDATEIMEWLDNYSNGDAIAGGILFICYGTK